MGTGRNDDDDWLEHESDTSETDIENFEASQLHKMDPNENNATKFIATEDQFVTVESEIDKNDNITSGSENEAEFKFKGKKKQNAKKRSNLRSIGRCSPVKKTKTVNKAKTQDKISVERSFPKQPSHHQSSIDRKKENADNFEKEENEKSDVEDETLSSNTKSLQCKLKNSIVTIKRPNFETKMDKKSINVQLKKSGRYSCSRCNEVFATTAKHNKHVRSKQCLIEENYATEAGSYPCEVCNVKFPRLDYLAVHKTLHTQLSYSGFTQIFCDLMDNLLDAEKRESAKNCVLCTFDGETKKELIYHLITVHGMIYSCLVCERALYNKNQLKKHRERHRCSESEKDDWLERSYKCDQCRAAYSSRKMLMQHVKRVHGIESDVQAVCFDCRTVFHSYETLKDHMKVKHDKPFVCREDECGKGFTSEAILKFHTRVHESNKCMCNICGKTFGNKNLLTAHIKTHDTARNFTCDICQKSYKTQVVLSRHQRIHRETKTYYCETCGFGCNQLNSLQRHRDMHAGVKRHQCIVCGKAFKHKDSLVNHKIIENHCEPGDQDVAKARKCPYCDRRIPSGLAKYKRHLLTHTGEKPHQCATCGRAFGDRSNLRCHERTHLTQKPFTCSSCGKGFIKRGFLNKHLESSEMCQSQQQCSENSPMGQNQQHSVVEIPRINQPQIEHESPAPFHQSQSFGGFETLCQSGHPSFTPVVQVTVATTATSGASFPNYANYSPIEVFVPQSTVQSTPGKKTILIVSKQTGHTPVVSSSQTQLQ